MAAPTIQTADTKNGVQTSNSTSWTATYPTNIVAGDLLLLFVAADGNSVSVTVSGFSNINARGSGANTLDVLGKTAAGTETGNFTISLDSEQGGWRIFRITGWFGGLPSAVNLHDGTGVDGVTPNIGTNNLPDPPSLDPGQWATEETLWFAACSADTSRTISVYPLADNNTADVSGGSTGATLGVCTTTSAVSSLNPSTFTISASDDWVATTIAVRPAAATFSPPWPLRSAHAIPNLINR